MTPTFAQLVFIVVLLVPGFITIKTFTYLIPTKKQNAFDVTVSSVAFTLFIHGVYSTLMLYIYNKSVNTLLSDITNHKWSFESSKLLIIYLPLLLLVSFLLGIALAYFKDIAWLIRIKSLFGFHHTPFENLWDEIMFIFNDSKVIPNVIVHFENISYFGQISRTTFEINKSDKKEILLFNPKYSSDTEDWIDCGVKMMYLDLKDSLSIYFVNGDEIVRSKI